MAPFTPQQLAAQGANPNMYKPPGAVSAPTQGKQTVYKTAGGQFSTDPNVLSAPSVPWDPTADMDKGTPSNNLVSVPGVGMVPRGTYGTEPATGTVQQPGQPFSPFGQAQNTFQGTSQNTQQIPPTLPNTEAPADSFQGQKYQQTLQNLNGQKTPAPDNAGQARMAIAKAAPPSPTPEYKPTPQFMQYGDPVMMQFIETALGQSQQIAQSGNLVKSIQAQFSSQIAGLNTEEMNIKRMMDGTDDDIRQEISKAGGFATESQIQALASNRNKDLIRQYNNIEIQKQGLQQQMSSQVQLAELDRQYAKDRYDNTMQAYTMYEKIQSNSNSSIDKLVGNVGYAGLAAAYNFDPYALSLAETNLSLPQGSLSDPRYGAMLDSLSSKETKMNPLDKRLKELQIAKAERDLSESPTNETVGDWGSLVDVTANLLPATRQPTIKNAMNKAFQTGDFNSAYTQIGNVVEEMLPGEQQNKFSSQRTDGFVLEGLRDAVKKYADGGGDMGLLKGTEESIKRKLGIDSGKATELAVMLWREFQTYRLNMTGAAFSPNESRDYASVNPTLSKSLDLNLNVIDGALAQINNRVDSTIKTRVTGSTEVRDLAKNGFALKGLTATFTDGSSLTFPNQSALDQFKKDRGL
jgi:hypothetical protein